jgi:hypothetical protein
LKFVTSWFKSGIILCVPLVGPVVASRLASVAPLYFSLALLLVLPLPGALLLLLLALLLPLPLPLKLPLVDDVVTLSLAAEMVSLAAATNAFSGSGPTNLLIGMFSLSCSFVTAQVSCYYCYIT